MDVFQEKLNALQKQSKEQITVTLTALQDAFVEGVQAIRIAVAIGNRLTPSQISTSFPVICLIDAMVMKKEEASIMAVLEEFWRIAPPLFINYASSDETLRDKVTRAVKRWGAKKVFESSICEKLLAAISGKNIEENNNNNLSVNEVKSTKDEFTRSEVSGFCSILQNCMKMIERLPPHRANMYLEVARKEKLLDTPSKSALLFFQGLHAELTRETAIYNSNVVKSEHQTSSSLNSDVDTKIGLSTLLDKLSKEQTYSIAQKGGNKDHGFRVIRYISPIQSDICQRLPLAQRSGFGEWHKRSKNEYHYPKKESNIRNVFRAPVGVQTGVRNWFPSEQQWISENDMAVLSLFRIKEVERERDSSSVYSVARKRGRET